MPAKDSLYGEPHAVVHETRARFESAPRYRPDEWSRMAVPTWIEPLYGYWGVPPYWAPPSGTTESSAGPGG